MKILIVDDEMTALSKMKAILAAYGECMLVQTAQLALQFFTAAIRKGSPFELITIDIHLGETNGITLLDTLNRIEGQLAQPPAKKLMVTASGTKDNLIRALVKGCDGFLVKPVKRDVLTEKMAVLGFTTATDRNETEKPAAQ